VAGLDQRELDARATESYLRLVARRVVCIAGTDGSDNGEVGRVAASQLGFRLIDEEVLLRAARIGGVQPSDIADVEARRSLLRRLLEQLGEAGAPEAHAVGGPMPRGASKPATAGDALRGLIQTAIEEIAVEGNAVIVAHAASVALASRDDAFRVLVTASRETRCRHLSEVRGISTKEAAKVVDDGDAARADYLKRFYGVREELPTHYDLVVNTDRMTPEHAAALVVHGAKQASAVEHLSAQVDK
jgi:cytidylate kinase